MELCIILTIIYIDFVRLEQQGAKKRDQREERIIIIIN